ncbi:MAG: bacillithiol biosynthesis cysteine-adding enzyme BshC [Rhodothermales bacterium]
MPTAETTIHTRLRRVPFATMSAFSALFTTYCADYDRLAAFYEGDWQSVEARRNAADRAAAHTRDRETLVEVLLEQNERWGLDPATRAHIEALRTSEAVAVVTGQQVGVLTGPLYTPYKTLTTLQLSRKLAEETGRPVVPVFWLEGTDHDLEEVVGVKMLRRNDVVSMRYTGHTLPEHGNLGPVGRLRLTEDIEDVLAQVEESLPPSEFRDPLLARLREAYRPGTTLLDAFARFMRALFPESGLVFLNPDDARLKRMAAPLFRQEIEDHTTSAARLREVSDTLEKGFHAQVQPRSTNLFLMDGAGRYALDVEGEGFSLRGTDTSYSRDALLALLDDEPERFSPNVVLRPLVQDILVPTAAYVGGPGEVSYFAQFKPIYAWAGVPMPIVYPRASVSLVEAKVQKVLDRYELDVFDVGEDLDRLFQRVVVGKMDVDVEALFKEAGRHLHQAVNALKPRVEQVDRTLGRSAEGVRAALLKEMAKFKTRVVRAEKNNHEAVRSQLEKAQVNLFPGGKLQERALSVLYFLNKYGLDLLTRLQRDLSLDTSEHQVIEL